MLRSYLGATVILVVFSSAIGSLWGIGYAPEWNVVSDADASRIIGGQTGTKCTNWTTVNCPTPKKNCVDYSCFATKATGAIEDKKYKIDVPCGTGDKTSKDYCPDTVQTYVPCT
jgi:hypothetical protein